MYKTYYYNKRFDNNHIIIRHHNQINNRTYSTLQEYNIKYHYDEFTFLQFHNMWRFIAANICRNQHQSALNWRHLSCKICIPIYTSRTVFIVRCSVTLTVIISNTLCHIPSFAITSLCTTLETLVLITRTSWVRPPHSPPNQAWVRKKIHMPQTRI